MLFKVEQIYVISVLLKKIQGRLTERNLFGGGKRFDRDDTLENSSQIQMMIF